MKIIHFANPAVPFVNSALDMAIRNLPYIDNQCDCECHSDYNNILHFQPCCYPKHDAITYKYDDLKNNNVVADRDECVLVIEAGQTQLQHGGWPLTKFKQKFPNSKIVLFCSDSLYYEVNGLGLQWGNEVKPDLLLECTPTAAKTFRDLGFAVEIIPWTTSNFAWNYLRNLAGPLDFSKKTTDFVGMFLHGCDYRRNLRNHLISKGYSYFSGGVHEDKYMAATYDKFLTSFLNIDTASHNRPELNSLGTQKGFRAATGVALNCLTINDNHPNVAEVWPMFDVWTTYPFGDFADIETIYKFYKMNLDMYASELERQQKWIEKNLMDITIYNALVKYGILP